MKSRIFLTGVIIAAGIGLGATFATAQCPVPNLVGGLRSPTKIIFSTQGDLLVTEAGNGVNNGRISIVDPDTGNRRTLLDGLPSGFAPPNNDPSGPSAMVMRGRTLYVAIGGGDEVLSGPLPNSFVPNPSPSSQIFSSVLAIHFSASVEMNTEGFVLTLSDQGVLKNGQTVNLSNSSGDKISIELLADFPDYLPEPRPGLPNGVRQSNPFGLVLVGDQLYIADASGNTIRVVDTATGNSTILTSFGPIPNNRGFGPPVVEAVPDSIHLVGDQLLVTLLSGFPFPLGNGQVRSVDRDTGANAPFITGMSSAIDLLSDGHDGFYTLEFSADMLAGLPGRLRHFETPSATPTVVSSCLITPTGMVQDSRSGIIYVTQIATGQVVKLTP